MLPLLLFAATYATAIITPACAAGGTAAAAGPLLLRQSVHASDVLAVCNDGTQPSYYATPPRGASQNEWMIILPSSGGSPQAIPWCFPPAESQWDLPNVLSNCFQSFPTASSPQPVPPAANITIPCGGPHCIYSSNCTFNPTFCNFGKIVIPQCTFDNWLGDATRTFGNASLRVTKHYRGQRMLNATLAQIAKDLLNAKSKVLVAGNDGGGNLIYIQADRIGALLQGVANFPATSFAVVPIEGYWPNWNGYYEGYALQQTITGQQDTKQHEVGGGNAWGFMNFSGAVNPACVHGIDPSGNKPETHWRCLLAEFAGQYIKSRIFALEQVRYNG
jgi:hypothetical protein